jgi:hypothetical protein
MYIYYNIMENYYFNKILYSFRFIVIKTPYNYKIIIFKKGVGKSCLLY